MVSHSMRSIPALVNSSVSRSHAPEVTFMTSRISYSTMLTQKTPVSRMLAMLSLVPSRSGLVLVEANMTCGGT